MSLFILPIFLVNTALGASTNLVLGSVQVGDRTNKEVINLPKCNGRQNIKVNSIQIRVKKKPVQVDRLKVVFHNGQQQELNVKKHFKVGDNSKWLDLNGEARCIKKIVFVGDTDTRKINSKKKGTVVVAGKVKTNRSIDNDGPIASQPTANPTRLGAVRLGDQTERDSIQLPPCSSSQNVQVQQLQVKIKDNPVEINRVKVQFYNGSSQVLTVNKHLKVGATSPWLDLNGDKRCIQRITFVGDADTLGYRPGKQAKVVVLGK